MFWSQDPFIIKDLKDVLFMWVIISINIFCFFINQITIRNLLHVDINNIFYEKHIFWDFPGGAVDKTLCSQCRGPGFDPWSGN